MQLTLGRKGDYSVRAMIYLARHHGSGRRKSRQIAAEMDIPERYLPQIMANLVHHRLLVAVAGPDGGYSLARPPAEISLLEVVEAAEGPVVSTSCILRGGPCDWGNVCPMHVPWMRAQDSLNSQLRLTTFQELASIDDAIEHGTYPETADHRRSTSRKGIRGTP